MNFLAKALAISRLRIRVLEEKVGRLIEKVYGTFSIKGLEHAPQA